MISYMILSNFHDIIYDIVQHGDIIYDIILFIIIGCHAISLIYIYDIIIFYDIIYDIVMFR